MQSTKSTARKIPSGEELLEGLLESLELKEIQKQYLRSRWMEKLLEASQQAKSTRKWYMRLHIITLVGGVLLPGIIGMHIAGADNKQIQQGIAVASLVVAKVVAITAAAEHFLRYGDRWQDYQQSADSLDAEGWQFMQLAGKYQTYKTHDQAYVTFVNNVEQLIKSEQTVSTKISQDQDEVEIPVDAPGSVSEVSLPTEPVQTSSVAIS